ncbi:unnamed protein product, partial [Mesorhabditis spiculigera]
MRGLLSILTLAVLSTLVSSAFNPSRNDTMTSIPCQQHKDCGDWHFCNVGYRCEPKQMIWPGHKCYPNAVADRCPDGLKVRSVFSLLVVALLFATVAPVMDRCDRDRDCRAEMFCGKRKLCEPRRQNLPGETCDGVGVGCTAGHFCAISVAAPMMGHLC